MKPSGMPGARTKFAAGSVVSQPPRTHIAKETQMAAAQQTSNKPTVRRFQAVMNTDDAEVISSTIDELVEPAALIHTPLPIQATGAELLKEVSARLHRAFPDLHITIEDLIEEGDKVVSRQSVTGTHRGEYMGIPPTGKFVKYNEVFVVRFVDGRIAETWGIVDVLAQMRQLGVISMPPARATVTAGVNELEPQHPFEGDEPVSTVGHEEAF